MSRRGAVLAEMGLTPVWRLRNTEKKPHDLWIELKQAVPACTACGLHKTRKQTVLGVGDEKCAPHLMRQIELIEPKLIVAMGRVAAQALLNSDASIASLRGRLHRYAGVPLIVTYHPAYLLRSLPDKAKAWADLLFAKKTMAEL
jgi:uracil-DNA glycosylase